MFVTTFKSTKSDLHPVCFVQLNVQNSEKMFEKCFKRLINIENSWQLIFFGQTDDLIDDSLQLYNSNCMLSALDKQLL